MEWSEDIENILESIRQNAVLFNKNHKTKYFFYKSLEKYFRIPTIILSAVASVSSVGLHPYLAQNHISAITCGLSLLVGIINSIELYLKIQENLETELSNSKDFYTLAVDIHKTLNLSRENRGMRGNEYLEKKFNTFVKLVESGNLVDKPILDVLISMPNKKPGIMKILNKVLKEQTKHIDKSIVTPNVLITEPPNVPPNVQQIVPQIVTPNVLITEPPNVQITEPQKVNKIVQITEPSNVQKIIPPNFQQNVPQMVSLYEPRIPEVSQINSRITKDIKIDISDISFTPLNI
tara:strand:- start:1606 stop:2481 length:876 start_codon:yes stop_codon:yes gene_type:complete